MTNGEQPETLKPWNLKLMTFNLYVLILAGGTGTRLWPRSRKGLPKQLLPLISKRTMLQETVDRIRAIIPPERTFVATNDAYLDIVRAQLPELPRANIIGEPEPRGTAPSIGLGAMHIARRDPDAVMASLHADHFIKDAEGFRRALVHAGEIAARGFLVTLGIQPSIPETGYGYIQRGERLDRLDGQEVYRVERFLEKPDWETAMRFVQSGEYYWNSGIFAWQVSTLFEEFDQHLPTLHAQLQEIGDGLGTRDERETMTRTWKNIATETIDVGVMEKSTRVAVLPIDIGWSDVGSWATLLELLARNHDGNVVQGEHIGVDTQSSLIFSENRLIATVGLRDIIVVDTGDALLVCHKDRAQDVKKIVDELKQTKQERYL